MKSCPKCHFSYDDNMNFCFQDGCNLEKGNAVSDLETSAVPSQGIVLPSPKKKGKRRKVAPMLLIMALACAGGLYWLFTQPVYAIYPDCKKIKVKSIGGSVIVPITTDAPNSKWEAHTTATWMTAEKKARKICITCPTNNGGERAASVHLTFADWCQSSDSIALIQKGVCDGFANGHGYVDLGLSVKWASCNVGAHTPEDYGGYFAWGENCTKDAFTEANCKTSKSPLYNIAGDADYDVARKQWGGKWRMPTKAEIEELMAYTTTQWTECNGVRGRLVVSTKNGASIFFPVAGFKRDTSLFLAGECGYYWSSISFEVGCNGAYIYVLDGSEFDWQGFDDRSYGFSVRPVLE